MAIPAASSWPVAPAAVAGLVTRPDLWLTAAREVRRTARPGWWRYWPPLPVPAPEYRRFRSQTMYGGDGEAALDREQLLGFLEWCREQHRAGN